MERITVYTADRITDVEREAAREKITTMFQPIDNNA